MKNLFEVVVEISKNSSLKYEVDKKTGKLKLDRVLFGTNVYPHNYGYIENTKDHDGDPLDVIIISNQVLLPNTIVECRILGSLGMYDQGDRDTKLIAVINVDHRYNAFTKLEHIPKEWLLEIKDFFNNYKQLENKKVELLDFVSWDDTEKIIKEAQEMYKNN